MSSPASHKLRQTTPSIPTWREEYLEALKERDQREKVNYEFIDAYTRLADRTAVLEAEKSANASSSISRNALQNSTQPPVAGDGTAQLKRDLAESLRARGQLQSRLKVAEGELEKLKAKNKLDDRLIKELSVERSILATKVKDRDEELKGKAKLLEDVQDEMITLNLQVNMAEEHTQRLRRENKDLIDRWMARMGQEADAMNDASKFS